MRVGVVRVVRVAKPLELQVEELLAVMSEKWTSGLSIDRELTQLLVLNKQVKAIRRARDRDRTNIPVPARPE